MESDDSQVTYKNEAGAIGFVMNKALVSWTADDCVKKKGHMLLWTESYLRYELKTKAYQTVPTAEDTMDQLQCSQQEP